MSILSRHRKIADPQKHVGGRTSLGLTWITQRLTFYWLLLVVLLTLADLLASSVLIRQRWADVYQEGVYFNIIVLCLACALTMTTARFFAPWWCRVMLILVLLPLPILSIASGNVAALCVAIALLAPSLWLGRVLASVLLRNLSQLEAWSIGGAFGIVFIGALGFILGLFHVLRFTFIAPVFVATGASLVLVARKQLSDDLGALMRTLKRPIQLRPLHILLAGLTLGCIWLNIPGALAPEIRSDATRQRLVTAVHFAREGSFIPDDPDLAVATDTAFGEIAYAVPIALGSVQAAKLTHWIAGILCAIAIFALAKRLSGNWAGALAAFAFYNTLLVAYLSQTAYLDLLLTLLAVGAALCLIVGKGTSSGALIGAGICLGAGVVIKVHFGYIAIGLAVTAAILAQPGGWRHVVRHVALLTFAGGAMAMPWLIRSALLTNTLPGYGYFFTAFFNHSNLGDLPNFGYGRSPLQLIIAPLTTTFLSAQFGGIQLGGALLWGGHIGFLPLALLPLLLKMRLQEWPLAIIIGTTLACLFWFYTAQHVRYLLPALALFCVSGGIAYAGVWAQTKSSHTGIALNTVVALIAIGGALARIQLPDSAYLYAFGMQDRETYLLKWLQVDNAASYQTIQLLNNESSATRVFAYTDGARLYTNIRISTATNPGFEGDDEQILDQLQAGGYSHILVDRSSWPDGWDKLSVIDEGFLRRNTALVGGGQESYLYRILPPDQRGTREWAAGTDLLQAQRFSTWHENSMPITRDGEITEPIRLMPGDDIYTTVSVHSDTRYLLSTKSQSSDKYAKIQIRVEWKDVNNKIIATSQERVPASPHGYHTFSIIVNAPVNASRAVIHASAGNEAVWFDGPSLRSVQSDTENDLPYTHRVTSAFRTRIDR